MTRFSRVSAPVFAVVLSLSLGCAGAAWRQALEDDSPAAYYRFLRDNENTRYADLARARLDYHKVKRRPSLEAFDAFREQYPDSELIDQLRPLLEVKAFEKARSAGTAEAYEEFLVAFPSGPESDRARGNAAYVRARGFGGDPAALSEFATQHAASDFAAEAQRSVESLRLREQSQIKRVLLRIAIAPQTPDAKRIRQAFVEAVQEQYKGSGITLVNGNSLSAEQREKVAQLSIEHGEFEVQPSLNANEISRRGFDSVTRVTLKAHAEGAEIWKREFRLHADPHERVQNASMLFGPTGRRFWSSFFVPVSSWQSNHVLRAKLKLGKRVTGVDAVGERAAVLYEDGDFQLLDLADPAAPVVLAQHQRERDLKQWSGIRVLPGRFALFGEDGLELVRFTETGSETLAALERGTIGSIVAVEPLGKSLLLGGKRGLILVTADGQDPSRLLRRDIQGLAVVGDRLIFSDGDSVFMSSVALLREGRVLSQLRLGRTFGPARIRAFENTAVVVGHAGAIVLDMSNPRDPRVATRLQGKDIGRIYDVGRTMGRTFLLGDRGLQLLDASSSRIEESIDIEPRQRVDAMGRHMVAIGDQSVQVVDATPFRKGTRPASVPARAGAAQP